MAKHIGWELYRSFLGVLQEGSLSGAARALGLTQPTVGRHIEALETSLRLTLFIRSQGGLQPTAAAEALRVHAEEMANTAAAFQRAAANQSDGAKGVVRVTASEVVAVEVLPPIFTRIREAYPGIQLELVMSNRPQDLLHREADIAVRMFRPRQTQLIARRIGVIQVGLHAHAHYLERHGSPSRLEDLNQHALIGYDQTTAYVRQAIKALPVEFVREQFAVSADSDIAQLAMIRAGVGIGFCQVPLARRAENLVQVMPELITLPLETWVTMHENLRNSQPCRAVFDGLVAGLQRYME